MKGGNMSILKIKVAVVIASTILLPSAVALAGPATSIALQESVKRDSQPSTLTKEDLEKLKTATPSTNSALVKELNRLNDKAAK
jgi:hypothetical protein